MAVTVVGTITSDTTVVDPTTALQDAISAAQGLVNALLADIANTALPASQVTAARAALPLAQSSLIALQSFQQQQPNGAYTVTLGDTLFTIAQGVLGDATLYKNIMATNGLRGLNVVPGQTLAIPNV
jgi:nucleoid-associated protein YgaU